MDSSLLWCLVIAQSCFVHCCGWSKCALRLHWARGTQKSVTAELRTIKKENCSLSLVVILVIHPLGYCVCILEGLFVLVHICIKYEGPKLFGRYQQFSV